MDCCFDTIIDCCQELTETASQFIDAMERVSGMTRTGLMKNKRCNWIITNRERK
jgi:hypothetical protein